jgi:uncharacterized protein (TIRG00374 family)
MKKIIFNLAVVAIITVFMIILLFSTQGLSEIKAVLGHMNYRYLAAAFTSMALYWFMDGVILQIITKFLFRKQRFMDSLKVTMVGQFFNSITPFTSGGQPAQAYVMTKDGVDAGHAASILVIKSILFQVMLVLYTFFAVLFKAHLFTVRVPHFFVLFFLGILANAFVISIYLLFFFNPSLARRLILALFRLIQKIGFIKKKEQIKNRLEGGLKSFKEGAQVLKRNFSVFIKLIVLQLFQLTFYFIIPYFIYLSVEQERILAGDIIAAHAIVNMITSFVPTPGSAGGAEGIGYLFFSMFFQQAFVAPAVLIWRLITYYSCIVFGGLFSMLMPERPLEIQSK